MWGDYIKYMRIERCLTQRELAHKLFIAPSTLSHYEVGTRMVPYSVLDKAMKIMNYKITIVDCKKNKEITKMEIERIK